MRFLSSMRIVRVTLALAVALWMAGAGCLLGCEDMVRAAAADHGSSATTSDLNIVATGEACASMRSHDCCARGAKSGPQSVPKPSARPVPQAATTANNISENARTSFAVAAHSVATSQALMECPLAVNAMAALSKPRQNPSSTALPFAGARRFVPNAIEQTIAYTRQLRLPNRGHTYLHCCVFLI
jgi:hypothetical protein